MKQIIENSIVSITADSEDPNFPAVMMLDNHPKRKYKAMPGVSAAIISALIAAGCSDIMFAGTNAATANVTVTDPNATVWHDAVWGNTESTNVMSPFVMGLTNQYETFTTSGVNITSAINSSGTGQAYAATSSLVIGRTYELIIDMTINSGFGPYILTGSLPTIPTGVIPSTFIGAGRHRIIFTAAASMGYIWLRNTGAADYSATFILQDYQPVTEWKNKEISISGSVIQRDLSESLWITLDETVDVSALATIELYGPNGQALEVGVCTAGNAVDWAEPGYGLGMDSEDYSIEDQNSNGSYYYKKRDTVRMFSLNALFSVDDAFRFMSNYRNRGKQPSAWKLTNATGNEWVVYGRMTESPKASFAYENHIPISFNIIEVL